MTDQIRRVLTPAASFVAGCGLAALAVAGLPSPTAVAAATAARSPVDALRAGAAPRSVPYAIGTTVYFAGRRTDVGARIDRAFPGSRPAPAQRQLTVVTSGAGYAWAQFTGSGVDVVHVVGRISSLGGWTGFHSSSGASSRVAVTTTRLVGMPESGLAYRTDGSLAATFTGSTSVSCGFCGASAAGPYLVIDRTPSLPGAEHQGTWLWLPGSARPPVRLPDGSVALGRSGPGWLGVPAGTTPGAACWQVTPATVPVTPRARLCSQALPLVSADGSRAVVVQGGRLRVVDTRTAAQISRAALGPLASWAPDGRPAGPAGPAGSPVVRFVVPVAWETSTAYLATVRDDRTLAMVRCSTVTGKCERAVRAVVRAGVTDIVSERGPQDLARLG